MCFRRPKTAQNLPPKAKTGFRGPNWLHKARILKLVSKAQIYFRRPKMAQNLPQKAKLASEGPKLVSEGPN